MKLQLPGKARATGWALGLASALAFGLATPAHAVSFNDAAGDWLGTYAGSRAGDLDVLSAFVTYNPSTDVFVFSGTMNADIGTTPTGFFVWGVNRGAGTAGFAANGLPNVLFDAVVVFNPDGSGRVTGNNPITFAPGTATIVGSTIIGRVSGANLPSTGFAKVDYTWNLWPRDGAAAGFAAISDFAPNNTNLGVTVLAAVPEPTTLALFAAGLGAVGLVGVVRRRPRA